MNTGIVTGLSQSPAIHRGDREGIFESWWSGETLYARNHAINDTYPFGWSTWPEEAVAQGPTTRRERALVHHVSTAAPS
jgi:hypothetical protein